MQTGRYLVFNQLEEFFESTYTDTQSAPTAVGIFVADVVKTKPDEDELITELKKISSNP